MNEKAKKARIHHTPESFAKGLLEGDTMSESRKMTLNLTGYQLLKVDRQSKNYDISLVEANAEIEVLKRNEAVRGRKWKRFNTRNVKGWVTPNETAPEYMIVRVNRKITVGLTLPGSDVKAAPDGVN